MHVEPNLMPRQQATALARVTGEMLIEDPGEDTLLAIEIKPVLQPEGA
jgi:hypothetical protein